MEIKRIDEPSSLHSKEFWVVMSTHLLYYRPHIHQWTFILLHLQACHPLLKSLPSVQYTHDDLGYQSLDDHSLTLVLKGIVSLLNAFFLVSHLILNQIRKPILSYR